MGLSAWFYSVSLEVIQLEQKIFSFAIDEAKVSKLYPPFLHIQGVNLNACEEFVSDFAERRSVKGKRNSMKVFLQECARVLSTSGCSTSGTILFRPTKSSILDLKVAPNQNKIYEEKMSE